MIVTLGQINFFALRPVGDLTFWIQKNGYGFLFFYKTYFSFGLGSTTKKKVITSVIPTEIADCRRIPLIFNPPHSSLQPSYDFAKKKVRVA